MSAGINQFQNNSGWDSKVNFWTPIKCGQHAHTREHKALERIDSYFQLKSRRVAVVTAPPSDSASTPVRFQHDRTSLLLTVVKIISFATVVIPLIMLIAKGILRTKYDFHSLPPTSGSSGGIPLPHMVLNPLHFFNKPDPAALTPNPLDSVDATPEPEEIEPISDTVSAASLLQNYKLGKNAKGCSQLMLKLYSDIPEPADALDLYKLPGGLASLGNIVIIDEEDGVEKRVGANIVQHYDELIWSSDRSQWDDRFLKMTALVYENIMKLDGDELNSARTVLAGALINAFAHCSNRKSTEIERLYELYVVPELLAAAQSADMPKEKLMYEFMNCRMEKRDEIINRRCPDQHNAASHRYFRKKLDEKVFFLPPPPLCSADEHYANFAKIDQESAIIQEFQNWYHNPQTIYDIAHRLIHPESGDKSSFKATMFTEWVKTSKYAADPLEEDFEKGYKPQVIIAYLTEKGFLAHK